MTTSWPAGPQPKYYLIVNRGTALKHQDLMRSYPWHMLLADVLNKSSKMMDLAAGLCREYAQSVILDNGAHEGEVFPHSAYLDMALYLQPHVLVLPDAIGASSAESYEISMAFASRAQRAGLTSTRFMMAVQGSSREDIVAGYERACKELPSSKYIIGFGQSYLTFCNDKAMVHTEEGRYDLFTQVNERLRADQRHDDSVDCHILGARWHPTPLYRRPEGVSRMLNVLGVDSIKPCRCAIGHTMYPVAPVDDLTHRLDLNSDQVASQQWLINNVKAFCRSYNLQSGW